MSSDYILIPGPPVRAASWEPTADRLRNAGFSVHVPDVLARCTTPPSWRTWTRHLLDCVSPGNRTVVVGHSSACALAVELATKTEIAGLILVDGDIPLPTGSAPPVRPSLLEFINGMADETGSLPPWSQWFAAYPERAAIVGLDILQRDHAAFERFESGLPRLYIQWFRDQIELVRWDHIPAAYVQTSSIYDHATMEARRRGWPTAKLNGTHLDPMLRPAETADAIMSMTKQIVFPTMTTARSGFTSSC